MSKNTIANFERIKKDILNKKFSPIYFLCGEENFYIDQLSDLLEEHVLNPVEKSFDLSISYGKETSAHNVVMSCKKFPMFSPVQLIMIKDAQNMSDIENLEDYFLNPMEKTILVLCYRNKTLDKRKTFAKALKKHELFETELFRDYEIPTWISNYFKEKNRNIDPKAIELISEYVGNNLQTLKSEIDKMLVNVKEEVSIINVNHVEQNIGISKDYNFFELQKAIGAKNFNKSIQITNYFVNQDDKGHLLSGISILMNYFNKIYICHGIKTRSHNEIAQTLGVNNFFVGEYLQACNNYSREDIEMILGYLKYYDLCAKGVNNASAKDGQLLIELVVKILKISEIRKTVRNF